ncbi:PTS galactitol transporter subunit IIC [Haloimpatiens sp. FM7330]|uniref:PTS galactitol transporter subunit IIC n=1 Tax=Haloimpatiens sp. FM7330 TaxID=3298610 RepID=UPI0036331EAD
MSAVIHYILDLGAGIFLPIIMITLGLLIGMKAKKAITAGLTLGIAFVGMNVILGFMFGSISPAANAFVKSTGIQLNAIDVGWSPWAAVAWAWPYALAMFPLQIVINIAMLALGWTDCLNVDMWNVWGKILTAVIVSAVTGSLVLAFLVAAIQVVFELKSADITQKQTYEITKIPGIACSHPMALTAAVLLPFNKLLDLIPGIGKTKIDAAKLKQKIGIFGENSTMGFIVGSLIAGFGGYDVKGILTTGIQVATALVLFPMVAKLFMQALSPIADAMSELMKKRFKGRKFYIGLDWPFLAGQSEIWVTAIVLVPVELVLAIVLAKLGLSSTLPLGSIINICLAVPLLIITGGDLIRMIIIGIMATPLYLIVSSQFSPLMTDLAKKVGTIDIPKNQLLAYFGIESPDFRWAMAHGANIINGDILGLVVLIGYLALFVWYYKHMKKVDAEIDKKNGVV